MALTIGGKAPDFEMPGTDGKNYRLEDVAGSKMTLIIFSCNHCPYVQALEPRMFDIIREYADKGLGAAFVCSNNAVTHPQDSFDEMKKRAEQLGYPAPYLHDESQEVAKAFGAQRTPEAFLFDRDGKLRYRGRFDDNAYEPENTTTHEVRDAITSILADKEVPVTETVAIGCTIKWK